MTRIVSLWLPCWPIDRLRRHDPSAVPDDRPFALVTSGARGIHLTAVNDPAARVGVHAGLSLADARAACPRLLTRPAEPKRDAAALARLAHWLGRYGPTRNVEGHDGAWIDITGVAHLFGGENGLMDDLTARLAALRISARAGLADTPGAAYALARYGGQGDRTIRVWTIAPAGDTLRALSPLPVAALRLDAAAVLLLKRLGLRRIGDLTHLPRAALERRFTSAGSSRSERCGRRGHTDPNAHLSAVLLRLDQALGMRSEPRAALCEPPVQSCRRMWSEPLIASGVLLGEIESLTRELCARLKDAGLGARRVALTLYRSDGTCAQVIAGCSRASTDARHIFHLLQEKLRRIDAGFGIDAAVLDASLAEPVADRQPTFYRNDASADPDTLAALIDRLSGRLGEERISCLGLGASHIPERAHIRHPAAVTVRRPYQTITGPVTHNAAARPLLILTPPEPVSVLAEVPEGPPIRFTWRRVARAVAKARGPERVAPEWWRHLATPKSKAGSGAEHETKSETERDLTRDYYVVEAADGARFWMFREGRYGCGLGAEPPRWFLHGLFN